MAITTNALVGTLIESFGTSHRREAPYRHWLLRHCLPEETVDTLLQLPFPAPDLGGLSGKREIHNATRKYFDAANRGRLPVCEAFCRAFQGERMAEAIASQFGAKLPGCYLRIEYGQDTDGFWLEPHTDLGVKTFTMLLYLSKNPQHASLGTPFAPNSAMVFIPSSVTYHGFEARKIEGVRKSLIINYVTSEWRAREQLAFPDRPIGA
jgi:hypothetical protein